MKKKVCFTVLFLVLTVSIPGAAAQFCEGMLYSNLIPGDTAIVVSENQLNVRSEPSLSGERLARLESDTELPVIGGPVCADGYAWYEIRLDDDSTGWVAEADNEDYWLGKLPRQYVTYERPADPNGTSPTVRFTYPESSIDHIEFDMVVIQGTVYHGEEIILRTLDGQPIFITAIPFEDFETGHSGGYDQAEVLHGLVDEWSDVALDAAYAYPNSGGEWPTLVVLKELEEFQNGRGFSYVAAYINTEELQPVYSDSFWYAFHGVTDDGAYFVNVTVPIQTPQLPEGPPLDPDDMTEYFAGYKPWIDEIRDFLLPQNAASFSPMLSMVKGIVYSLEIE
jgi:hypothetical protein